MTIRAVYEKGVFKPSEPVALREGTAVEVVVAETAQPSDPAKLADAFLDISAKADRGKAPNDGLHGSRDHDAILYGDARDTR